MYANSQNLFDCVIANFFLLPSRKTYFKCILKHFQQQQMIFTSGLWEIWTLTKIYVELIDFIYHTGNGGISAWIEDDFCDDINNKEECDYDGGDCCGLSVQNNFCVDCKCKCE